MVVTFGVEHGLEGIALEDGVPNGDLLRLAVEREGRDGVVELSLGDGGLACQRPACRRAASPAQHEASEQQSEHERCTGNAYPGALAQAPRCSRLWNGLQRSRRYRYIPSILMNVWKNLQKNTTEAQAPDQKKSPKP